jgi:F0F1-type ATP synthase membrane subunit b/b'
MEILKTLNINATLFYQFGVFLFTYAILAPLLFKPYLKAHLRRAALTNFSESTASQLLAETKEINIKYDFKVREMNDRISEIFSSARTSAQHEYEGVIQEKRNQIDLKLADAREKIESQSAAVRTQLKDQVAAFSEQVTHQLLGNHGSAGQKGAGVQA